MSESLDQAEGISAEAANRELAEYLIKHGHAELSRERLRYFLMKRLWTKAEAACILGGVEPRPLPDVLSVRMLEGPLFEIIRDLEDSIRTGHLQVMGDPLGLRAAEVLRRHQGTIGTEAEVNRLIGVCQASNLDEWRVSPRAVVALYQADPKLFPRCPEGIIEIATDLWASESVEMSSAPAEAESREAGLSGLDASVQPAEERQPTGRAAQGPHGSDKEQLAVRAEWLKGEMARLNVGPAKLHNGGGPDAKTTHKILRGEPVSERTLEKLARRLEISRQRIP